VNGSGSETTHIYDPNHTIFYAWKEIIQHWKYLYEISSQNHLKGINYMSASEVLNMYSKYRLFIKQSKSVIH
jgi:hypothetical protein